MLLNGSKVSPDQIFDDPRKTLPDSEQSEGRFLPYWFLNTGTMSQTLKSALTSCQRLTQTPTPAEHPSIGATASPLELLMCTHQLSVGGDSRQTKGESRRGPCWQSTGSSSDTGSKGDPEAPTPVPAQTPTDVSRAPSLQRYSATVSILGGRIQNEVAQWGGTPSLRQIAPCKFKSHSK